MRLPPRRLEMNDNGQQTLGSREVWRVDGIVGGLNGHRRKGDCPFPFYFSLMAILEKGERSI